VGGKQKEGSSKSPVLKLWDFTVLDPKGMHFNFSDYILKMYLKKFDMTMRKEEVSGYKKITM
jgi:hypothetical protein